MAKIDKETPVKFIETTTGKLNAVISDPENAGAFIHVNDDNGDDQLYIGVDQITDKFNVGDTPNSTPTRKVGGLTASTIGQLKQKSISEIILDMVRPDVVEPTVSTPASVSISYAGPKLIEVGTNLPVGTIINDDIKDGVWSDGTPYAGGHSVITLGFSPGNWGEPVEEGTYMISGSVIFYEGGIPKDNFGTSYPNKQYHGGTKNADPIKITAVYPIYVNDSSVITDMRKHIVNYISGTELNVTIPKEVETPEPVKFMIIAPYVFNTFVVKQFNPLTQAYDINVPMSYTVYNENIIDIDDIDFEDFNVGGAGQLTSSGLFAYYNGGDYVSITDEFSHSGTKSVKLDNSSGYAEYTWDIQIVTKSFPVEPGKTYRISWYNKANVEADIQIDIRGDESYKYFTSQSGDLNKVGTDWEYQYVDYKVVSGTELSFAFYCGVDTATYYFDDIKISVLEDVTYCYVREDNSYTNTEPTKYKINLKK